MRRQDLLQVTLSCLSQLGPRGTTGREICRQAGVSHGLLRHYFANPQNLLLETYEDVCNQFIARFRGVLAQPHSDPWQALDAFFENLFSEEWASPELLGAWLAFCSLVRNNPEFAEKNAEFHAALHELLSDAMARLPAAQDSMPIKDAVPIMRAAAYGLWLDFCLSPEHFSREGAVTLCQQTLRRLFPLSPVG